MPPQFVVLVKGARRSGKTYLTNYVNRRFGSNGIFFTEDENIPHTLTLWLHIDETSLNHYSTQPNPNGNVIHYLNTPFNNNMFNIFLRTEIINRRHCQYFLHNR